MFVKAKLQDYRLNQRRDGQLEVIIAFLFENKLVNYRGSLSKGERISKNGKPYTFYGITKGTLEDLGMSPDTPLELLEDQDLKKKKPVLGIGKEFTVEITKTEKDGKTYEQVFKIQRDRVIGVRAAKALLAANKVEVSAEEDAALGF